LTKEFLPTAEEKKLLSATQIFHDFVYQVINPKSMDHEKFFGVYNSESNEWTDGCITKMFRTAAAASTKTDKTNLIIIDGPIEPNWAEDLNSVMDDNKKLCFGAGEFIALNERMKVLFEASDLQHTSPATISRCNIVYMEQGDEILPVKAHVNKWIHSLPPILMSEVDRLDMVINYFLINIRDLFTHPHMLLHPMSRK
jgi:dynein heavy chain